MAGYTRQSVADIVPTAVVRAAPINAEYNKLRDAFAFSSTGTTGHKHDGSSDEGSYVPLIADLDGINKIAVDTTNNRHGVFVQVASSSVEQVRFQDGVILPVVDNDIDLGSSSYELKNVYVDGTAYLDTVSIGDNDYTVITNNAYTVTGDLTFDVSGDINLDADGGDVVFKDGGTTYATFTSNAGNLILKSGSTTAVTFTGANADLAGTLDVTGAATFDSTLGVTGNTTLSGTLGVTGATTLNNTMLVYGAATFDSNVTVEGNLTVNGTLSTINTTNTVVSDKIIELGNGVTGTPSGDAGIVIERGTANNAFIGFDESEDKFIVGTGTFTGASTGNLSITKGTLQANLEFSTLSDGTRSVTAILDEDNFASDSATALATQQSIKAYVQTIAGQSNNVVGLTATAAELNTLDASAASPSTITVADADGFILLDTSAGQTVQALASDLSTYVGSKNLSNLADAATARTNLGVAIGSDVQAYDSNLNTFVGIFTLPTSDGTSGQFLQTNGSGTLSFQSVPTINTLNDIGDVTITSAASGEVLSWNGAAWVNTVLEAFDTQTASTSSTSQTAIASYAVASYDGVKAVITVADSTAGERSITEIIITHDGTTAVATEYAQVNTATALATFEVDISAGNVRILATPASGNSMSFTVKAITL